VHVCRADSVSAPASKQAKSSRIAAIKMRMLLSVQYASVHEAMMVHSDRVHEATFCEEEKAAPRSEPRPPGISTLSSADTAVTDRKSMSDVPRPMPYCCVTTSHQGNGVRQLP
jgi:hypothetical protein